MGGILDVQQRPHKGQLAGDFSVDWLAACRGAGVLPAIEKDTFHKLENILLMVQSLFLAYPFLKNALFKFDPVHMGIIILQFLYLRFLPRIGLKPVFIVRVIPEASVLKYNLL